jgi:hypothetical protein
MDKVATAKECCLHCKSVPTCWFYTHSIEAGVCYLMDQQVSRKPKEVMLCDAVCMSQ